MTEPTLSVENVDPSTLLVDVNIRTENTLDKAFIGSIRDLGVIVPIVAVRTAEGGIRVRHGHRRTLAAVEAGRTSVPVVIVGEDDADDVERIVTQWHENEYRAGLSTADKLAAVEQLSLLGLSTAQIVKRTKAPKAEVEAAVSANASALAKGAADRYDFLTLDQAAAVAEFESDAIVAKALVVAAKKSDGEFRHVLQRARDEREQAAAVAALIEQATAAGVKVIDRPDYDDKAVRRLTFLSGADKKRLTAEAHAACPGHAVYIEKTWQGVEAVAVCTDWKAQGHVDPHAASRPGGGAGGSGGGMSEQAKAERRLVIQNNKEWKSAETVRRDWLAQFLARKTPPKGAAVYLATELGHGPRQVSDALSKANGLAATLLGADENHSRKSVAGLGAAATDARAQVIALAVVLAAVEESTSVQTWRGPDEATKRYFAFLAAQGYVLSDVEKLAAGIKSGRRRRTEAAAEPTAEASPEATAEAAPEPEQADSAAA
jgi:ParB family chromosome partitioning protein